MLLKPFDTVTTPNGRGIFQFRMWSEGQELAAVSHKPDAPIDFDKCQGHMGDGSGIWYFCTYRKEEVTNEK